MKLISLITILTLTGLNFSSCQTNTNSNQQSQGGKLSVNDFEQKLTTTSNAQIVDVRTPEEFSGGHLQNANNIDWNGDSFETEIQKLDKTKTTFVYCLSGGRSSSAASRMKELGFKEIYEMKGGMMAWNNAGKPVTTNNNTPALKGMGMEEYNKKINSDKLVLVDFNAPWCAPCKKMAPMFEEIAIEQKSKLQFIKINVEENKELAKTLQIENLPTILLYKKGKEVWKHIGFIEKADLLKVIQSN